jgi:hypothetical protein
MLMKQESQVRCRFSGRRDRQQHNPSLCQTHRPLSPDFPADAVTDTCAVARPDRFYIRVIFLRA